MKRPVKPATKGFLRSSAPALMGGLALLLCLLTACKQERSLRIPTRFIEMANEELLSPNPDLLDRYNWSIILEYPDSIIDNENISYPALCDTLKENTLREIFGKEAVLRVRTGELPPSKNLREDDNTFVREVKTLTDHFNALLQTNYPAARDSLRGDLYYEVDVNGYMASTWKDNVSYHIYIYENEFGKIHEWERGYNFALDGHRIYESDIFQEEGWESVLSEWLTEEFHQKFKTRDIPLLSAPVRPNGNFKFAPGGVIWMFGAGEIAEARYGILRITLPWSKLSDLM